MSLGFVVMDRPCDECLFGPDRIVSAGRAAEVIRECIRDRVPFQCHKATIAGVDVCCAGFADRFPGHTAGMRFSRAVGIDRTTTVDQLERYARGEIDYAALVGCVDRPTAPATTTGAAMSDQKKPTTPSTPATRKNEPATPGGNAIPHTEVRNAPAQPQPPAPGPVRTAEDVPAAKRDEDDEG